MENLSVGTQKLSNFSPSWAASSSQVGQSSYIYKKAQHSHIYKKSSRKKSTSERLEIKYKTQDKLVRLLNDVGEDRTAQSMALCGQKFDVLTCGEHIVAETPNHRCNVRYCPLCSGRRANKYRRKYLPYALAFVKLSPVKLTPCLLTLTQKKIKSEKLKDSRERILKSFKKLIRHNFFADYFDGGIFTIENTISDDGNHCHIHCVVFRKRFIDHKLLKLQWAKVSAGAENLNIKLIDDLESGLGECIKYISKPLDVDKFERKHLSELLEIKGKRMIDTFGKFRSFSVAYELPEEEEIEKKEKLEEGNLCWKCNGNDNLLFHISMTANQKIKFYQQVEQVRGSPPLILSY